MRLDPYRPLFPLGVLYALAGTLVWPLQAAGWLGYPGELHRALAIQGFEQCFVAGFLLTALPGLLHGARTGPGEIALVVALQAGFGVAAFAGALPVAHAFYLAGAGVLAVAAVRRARPGATRAQAPDERVFILLALLLGIAGGVALLAASLGAGGAWPILARRLVPLGHVLTLVVGVGSLMVPTFTGVRDPRVIPGISTPTAAGRRRAFYGVAAALLGLSFVPEALGQGAVAAAIRAIVVTAVVLEVWKIHRPGHRTRLAACLRAAGWAVLVGLWLAALIPGRPLLGEHLLFIGGFGLLTMTIGTRVVVAHGRHPAADERLLLGPLALGSLALAVAARLVSELWLEQATPWLAASGTLWSLAWAAWAARALPRIVRIHATPGVAPTPAAG